MLHAGNLFTDRARLTPQREALLEIETSQRFTYAQLNARANKIANALVALGVKPGDRVSILAQNSVVYIDLFYGLGKIGAVFTPLNWRLAARELVYIVNDCRPKVLFVGAEYRDVYQQMRSEIDVQHIIALDGADLPDTANYQSLLDSASSDEPDRPPDLNSETIYAILYTSGTTGKPKGAMIPHRQVLFNAINTVVSWGLDADDVSPVFTPLFHAGGLFAFLTPILYAGGRITLARAFDTDESLRLIQTERCTVILGVPTLFQMWHNSPEYEKADFSHVKFFISGGAPCPPALIEAWRGEKNIVFRQGYGLTEVGANCFSMTDEESVPKTGSVGKPIFHSMMRLIDENGEPVPAGVPGELLIKGAHVCLGYWERPEATAEVLHDGWFHTGDIAQMDEDGFYAIIGRAKDMIISGGENIYAAEVEAVFREHPAVEDAALIAQPDEKWGEVGLMVVLHKRSKTVTDEELKAFCAERLARYKVPKRIVFSDSLPYSPYGKVMKAELRKQFLEG